MTQPNNPGGPVTYDVIQQSQRQVQTAGGMFVPGFSVTFRLSNGHIGTVDVPLSDYTPANVAAAIKAKAAVMVAVAGLTGTV
jgi:hypothetical protein